MSIWVAVRAYVLGALAGAALAVAGAYKVHTWRVEALRAEWQSEQEAAVAATKAEVQKICDNNNKVTKENAYALQAKLNATTERYHRLLQYHPTGAAGSGAPAGTAAGNNGQAETAVPSVCLNIADWAGAAKGNDEQAAALTTLQDVVASIYKANGQTELLPAEYQ